MPVIGEPEWFDRKVKRALLKSQISMGTRLLVAVSGGPDSLALLYSLYRLRSDLKTDLHCAHLNHGLRGSAGESDCSFVENTCSRLGIDFIHSKADVPELHRELKLSVEDAAREARYAFLAKTARAIHADAIVLGHTSDDQVETVLMNIIRGCGIAGLQGMLVSSTRLIGGQNVRLLRPMLSLSKHDTSKYCVCLGISPRFDESNQSLEPVRNRIRLKLLPLIKTFNPKVSDSIVSLSKNAAQVQNHLEDEVRSISANVVRKGVGQITLDKKAFQALDEAIQSFLIRRILFDLKGDLKNIRLKHIAQIRAMMSGPAGPSLTLPNQLRFVSNYYEGVLASTDVDLCPYPRITGLHELEIPGRVLVDAWTVSVEFVGGDAGKAFSSGSHGISFSAILSQNVIGDHLFFRNRVRGDVFVPAGMTGHKKVQDFMVDEKIPREWRDRVPLIVSDYGIAWIVGCRLAEWAKPTVKDEPLLMINVSLTGTT